MKAGTPVLARTSTSYLAYFDEIPPPLCLLIARKRDTNYARKLTVLEIAEAGGLPWQRVAWIGKRKSFAKVPLGDVDKFLRGCGITPQNRKRHKEYILRQLRREGGFEHLLKTAGETRTDWNRYDKRRFKNRMLKRL